MGEVSACGLFEGLAVLKLPVRVRLLVLFCDTSRVEVPETDILVHSCGHEAGIIFEPTDRSDESRVLLELPVFWPVPSVEFIHEDAAQALASEEVATVGELDLFALFDLELLVLM